jgi:hypothetical protein
MTRSATKRLVPITVGLAGLTLSLAFMVPSFADETPPPAPPATPASQDPGGDLSPIKVPKPPVTLERGQGACSDCVTGDEA